MAKSKAGRQPRAISPEVAIQPSWYRAPLYAELQKFGNSQRDSQLSLWHDQEEDPGEIIVSGLDLTVSEDKALSAIQKLMDETDYDGNRPGTEVESSGFKWSGRLPVLAITHSQYFEAYGLARMGDGSYYSHQATEALKALRSLATTPRAVYYERKHRKGKKVLTDVVRARAPVISLLELDGYQDLEPEEAEQFRAGQEPACDKKRANGLVVELSPLLVDGIQDFYLLKPSALHTEIQLLLGDKRASRAISLFIGWLLTKNTATVMIQKDKLIQRLRLSKYLEQRHREIADARLQEAIQVARELEYLLDVQDNGAGLLAFRLNPKKCSRIKDAQEGEEEDEE